MLFIVTTMPTAHLVRTDELLANGGYFIIGGGLRENSGEGNATTMNSVVGVRKEPKVNSTIMAKVKSGARDDYNKVKSNASRDLPSGICLRKDNGRYVSALNLGSKYVPLNNCLTHLFIHPMFHRKLKCASLDQLVTLEHTLAGVMPLTRLKWVKNILTPYRMIISLLSK
jgi:hypothetical protein